MNKIILASNSPRRKEILEKFGYQFEVMESDYKEEINGEIDNLIKNNCYCKAKTVADKIATQAIVIGADTVVTLDSVCLNKPRDFHEAFSYLKKLSNRAHIVKTAITVMCGEKSETSICETKVHFKNLSDEEITDYINTFKPFDKAGSYGVQDFINENETSGGFIEKIEGSYYNVMGICPEHLQLVMMRVSLYFGAT